MTRKKSSFQHVFDVDAERKRKDWSRKKVISLQQYLELLRDDPRIAQSAPARLHEIV